MHHFSLEADNITSLQQRLVLFLCHETRYRFTSPRQLSLYARASGHSLHHSRLYIENQVFSGGHTGFEDHDFCNWDLSGGVFQGLTFKRCDFTGCDFSHTRMQNVHFENCNVYGACFNHAELESTAWLHCENIESLLESTRPEGVKRITDLLCARLRDDAAALTEAEKEDLIAIYRRLKILLPSQAVALQASEDEIRGSLR